MSIFLIQHVYKAYLHHYDYHKPLICSQYFKFLMSCLPLIKNLLRATSLQSAA